MCGNTNFFSAVSVYPCIRFLHRALRSKYVQKMGDLRAIKTALTILFKLGMYLLWSGGYLWMMSLTPGKCILWRHNGAKIRYFYVFDRIMLSDALNERYLKGEYKYTFIFSLWRHHVTSQSKNYINWKF